MRRLLTLALSLVIVAAIGTIGWWIVMHRAASSSASALPIVQGPCPDNSNDLSGIEGWAPGAGQAEKMGQNGAGNMGGFGGALGGGSSTPTPVASTCPHLDPRVTAYFDRVGKLASTMPDDTYDPNKRAAELSDATAMFTWVRDHIATEGYAGALRGYAGTLQSRGGSPAEKAVLLAGMLQSKGIPAHLVHGALSDVDLDAIIKAIRSPQTVPVTTGADVSKLYADLNVDQNAAMSSLEKSQNAVDGVVDSILARAAQPVAGLRKQLSAANLTIAADPQANHDAWATNLRDHWWVQAQVDGNWIDLDPTLSDARPGSHLGAAPQGDPQSALPDSMKVTVAIKVIADEANGNAQKVLAQTSAAMQDLYGLPVSVSVGDHDGTWKTLNQSKNVVASITEGGESNSSDAFDPANIDGAPLKDIRVVFDTTIPGRDPLHYERVLFDGHSGAVPTIRASALIVSGDLDPNFAMLRDLENTRRYGALFAYAAAGGNGTQKPPQDGAEAYPVQAMHFFEYDALARRRLEQGGKVHFFFDRPEIAMVERALVGSGKDIRVQERFDIVDNGMMADGTDGAAAAEANLRRGFFDTLAEQNVLPGASNNNTIALWQALAAQHTPTHVVTNDPTYGPAAIVPTKSVALDGRETMGWWQIDPHQGNLVGRMQGGAGQAFSEYVTTLNDASSYWTAISFYADVLRCATVGITSPLRGESGDAAAATYWQCMSNAACGALEAIVMGELYTKEDADLRALAYNILDLSFDTHAGVSKDSWSPPGVLCNQLFPSDGSNNWSWGGSYGS